MTKATLWSVGRFLVVVALGWNAGCLQEGITPSGDGSGLGTDTGPEPGSDAGPGPDSAATPTCGDGLTGQDEACDDGNTESWDGCDQCSISELEVNSEYEEHVEHTAVGMAPDGRFVVVWQRYDLTTINEYDIAARLYDSAGQPAGPQLMVQATTQGDQQHPDVAMADDGSFVVVWMGNDGGGNDRDVFGRRFDPQGQPDGEEFPINTFTTGNQVSPAVASASDGSFVVAWASELPDGSVRYDIHGQRYDSEGGPLGGELQVHSLTDSNLRLPDVAAAADGRFVVVWNSYLLEGGHNGIFGQRYDGQGQPLGGEFQVSTATNADQGQGYVDMADDGSFMVVWYHWETFAEGWYGRRFDPSGLAVGPEREVGPLVDSGLISNPAVAMSSGGDAVVTWGQTAPDPLLDEEVLYIFVRWIDLSGQPIGQPVRVNLDARSPSGNPTFSPPDSSIAATPDGRSVVVWIKETGAPEDVAVRAQRFDADGAPLGALPW